MNNKKIFLVLVVVAFCMILSQSVFGQKAKNSQPKNVPGDDVRLLKNEDQRFFITVGQPKVGIMKDSSNPNQTDFWFVVLSTESAQDESESPAGHKAEVILPKTFDLGQNYPNPFNPSTTVQFQIPDKIKAENIRTVVQVFDVLGRVVKTLVDENLAPGFYTRYWDGLNDAGEKISSGVYFYSITAAEFRKTRGMLMLK